MVDFSDLITVRCLQTDYRCDNVSWRFSAEQTKHQHRHVDEQSSAGGAAALHQLKKLRSVEEESRWSDLSRAAASAISHAERWMEGRMDGGRDEAVRASAIWTVNVSDRRGKDGGGRGT